MIPLRQVVINLSHQLAGQTLNFDVELMGLTKVHLLNPAPLAALTLLTLQQPASAATLTPLYPIGMLEKLCAQGDSLRKATFAAGCFWGPELAFQRVPGVVRFPHSWRRSFCFER